MYKTITLCIYILTVNYSYFAKMLNYCTIICAWAGGLIFRNKQYNILYIHRNKICCISCQLYVGFFTLLVICNDRMSLN